jgi:hypothetical protein
MWPVSTLHTWRFFPSFPFERIPFMPLALNLDCNVDGAGDFFCGRLRPAVACKASLQMDCEQLRRRSKMMLHGYILETAGQES